MMAAAPPPAAPRRKSRPRADRKPKPKFHSPSSSRYDEAALDYYDGRAFWTRDEMMEMDLKFRAAMGDSAEWQARLRAAAKD